MSGVSGAVAGAVGGVLKQGAKPVAMGLAVEGVNWAAGDHAGNMLASLFELAGQDNMEELDNPYFVDNGHGGEPSPRTAEYFRVQKGLRCLTIAGRNMAPGLHERLANVGGVLSGVQTASTGLAWYRINALFGKLVPPSRRAKAAKYSGWFSRGEIVQKAVGRGSLEIKMTQIIRQKLYGAAGGAAKTALALTTGGLSGVFIGAAADVASERLGGVFGYDNVALARGLHWYAFLELVVGRGVASGPSLRILDVIWQEFGLAKAATGVAVREIVREPRGWMVIADMLA